VSDENYRQLRVLHVVSSGAVTGAIQQSLFMPLLTRMPKQRVKAQIAALAPHAVPAAVLRQNGVPVHDIALSRQRFSGGAFGQLVKATKQFRPDVIQAWGQTAQIVSVLLRGRCDWKPQVVWSAAETSPLPRNPGFIDRQKLKLAAGRAARADRIVYASEAGASQHRRAGYPDGGHLTVPPGIDPTRFKPDVAARQKVRDQLELGPEAFVIGMVAPFQPEFDHPTFLKAAGELIKSNPNVAVLLAGHGVQKGNAPLMALVGGGTLGTRTHLLGEWSDVASLFNACDVVCSSALNDSPRMTLVMAMLCGVPCVATGMGAQGEVIGQFGVAIEPGSPAAFIKGITRVLQLTPDKRSQMAQGARRHALKNYVSVLSLQKYLQLYCELVGRDALVAAELPTPEIDASVPVPPPQEARAPVKKKVIAVAELSDPDSLEAKVAERAPEDLPKWRKDQEEQRAQREAELSRQIAAASSAGDVLQVFEAELAKPDTSRSPMGERARGVAEELEDLLAPEALEAPSGATKPSKPAPVVATQSTASAPAIKRIEPAPQKPATVASQAPAQPASAPAAHVESPPAAAAGGDLLTEGETLSLFGDAPAAAPAAAPTPESSEFQLELLPDPPELKRAVGESP
jgi:glycosyltransferase involved in cell wall biosynthesis